MMQIVQFITIGFLLLTFGCKEKSSPKLIEKPLVTVDTPKKSHLTDINELYHYYYDQPENQDQLDENALINYIVDHNLSPTRSKSGLYYQIHDTGEGELVRIGDPLKVHYIGKYLDDSEFDNSYKKGRPLKFNLGSRLIQGWIEGLQYLKPGGKATLIVPSRLAYGKRGYNRLISPDTPLAFELEILAE